MCPDNLPNIELPESDDADHMGRTGTLFHRNIACSESRKGAKPSTACAESLLTV
jgi:hypothetical protein